MKYTKADDTPTLRRRKVGSSRGLGATFYFGDCHIWQRQYNRSNIMVSRVFKQIIIAAVFFLILSGFGFLIYAFSQPKPTCFDGIRNQEEEGIDCGGPCLECELKEIKGIEVLWIEAVRNQNNFYDLAAKIKNPNQNYGSGEVPYQFKIYDRDNNLITEISGQTYILPNQTKYLITARVEVNRSLKRINLSFGEIDWQKLSDAEMPQLAIQQKEYHQLKESEPGFSQVRGVLVNKSSFDFEQVDIDILLYDSLNKLVGVNRTEIKTLLSGQERDFFATWFSEIDSQVVFVEMEAETNIFDPDNYLPTGEGLPEKFQEY